MRRLFTIIFLITMLIPTERALGAVKGGVDYSIPVEYQNLSEDELEQRAKAYYFLAEKENTAELTETKTHALTLYTVLKNMDKENQSYYIKLGSLYDKIGKDRFAKGNLSEAIGINSSNPEPYFYMGKFYYKREMYRKALKYYQKAYDRGYMVHYDNLWKMGDIYEKFGDTREALKYLNMAEQISPNPELENKIKKLSAADCENKIYYPELRDKSE